MSLRIPLSIDITPDYILQPNKKRRELQQSPSSVSPCKISSATSASRSPSRLTSIDQLMQLP